MKVINLLNKIANGEEVPEKIKYDTKEMKYDRHKQDYLGYYSNGNGEWLFQYLFNRCRNTKHFINDEVEIIEEKKIPEKLPEWATSREDKEYTNDEYHCIVVARKVDEIIDYLESKEKGE